MKNQIKLISAEYFDTQTPASIIFTAKGTLTILDPITFDDNIDEHAKAFFEYVCNNFKLMTKIII
jgi:hypothetical protein